MTLKATRLIGGRYELDRVIGSGGAGTVHLAWDRVLHRDVALKLLRPGYDELAHLRLRTEARIAAALSHPGIARVLDFGEETVAGETAPYLVMEYVAGPTLRDALRDGTHLTPARVLRLIAEVADALAAAHAAGVVHRDVKPGNIVLTPGGRVVLLDFGIARHAELEPLTVTGTIVGTLDYLSPEQADGASSTPRSDLYALGMVAYEALTGLRPLSRDTQIATLIAHAKDQVPPLPATVPEGLRSLVMSLVARDPSRRPADAATVAARARALLRPTAVGASSAVAATPERWWRNAWTSSAAAVAVVALTGIAVLAARPDGGTAPVSAAAPATTPSVSPSRTPSHAAVRSKPTPATTTAPVVHAHPVAHGPAHHGHGPRPHQPPGHRSGPGHGPGPGHGRGHGPDHGPAHGHGHHA